MANLLLLTFGNLAYLFFLISYSFTTSCIEKINTMEHGRSLSFPISSTKSEQITKSYAF